MVSLVYHCSDLEFNLAQNKYSKAPRIDYYNYGSDAWDILKKTFSFKLGKISFI